MPLQLPLHQQHLPHRQCPEAKAGGRFLSVIQIHIDSLYLGNPEVHNFRRQAKIWFLPFRLVFAVRPLLEVEIWERLFIH